MAILLYPNGVTEEYKPNGHTFTDDELLHFKFDKALIRSFRLYEVPNTWCIWGERQPQYIREAEANQIGSIIVDQPCWAPILFVHDSEINPDWRLTDDIIVSGYPLWKNDLGQFFDEVAKGILEEREEIRKNSPNPPSLMVLEEVGVSDDKRVIYKFVMEKQTEEFFTEKNLNEFAQKVHNFLKFSYKDGEIFAIYADPNIIIVTDDKEVKPFIDKMIAYFESKENYEACSVIRNTYNKWAKYKKEQAQKKKK